jgi:hypothetical protein
MNTDELTECHYPSEQSSSALWYDPVFKVNTLDGRQVWCKRHYRCMPRPVAEDLRTDDGTSAGAWTLTTLDNGVLSREHWTTVDAADDLTWAVFHYSGGVPLRTLIATDCGPPLLR